MSTHAVPLDDRKFPTTPNGDALLGASSTVTLQSSSSLASFHPLCFSKDVFNAQKFSEDEFILECRQRVPLESVLSDLKKFSAVLETELVELINKDYAQFVNLSSNLIGIDKVVNDLRSSILSVRKDVQSVRSSVDAVIVEMETKLEEKRAVGRKKAVLQLFADAHATLGKIEKLLQLDSESLSYGNNPNAQAHLSNSSTSSSASPQSLRVVLMSAADVSSSPAEGGGDASGLIERVSTDFNQLKYYVSRVKNMPFMERVEKRMRVIEQLLVEGLEQVFRSALLSESNASPSPVASSNSTGSSASNLSSSNDMIANCLRTYAAIERVQEAERVFRVHMCVPKLQQLITEERLEGGAGRGGVVFESLSRVYSDVLAFVERDCSALLAAARTCSSSAPFSFVASAVFPTVTELLISKGGPRLFAAGLPDAFHKHFSATLLFIDLLERHASNAEELQRMRSSQAYTDFMRRFNTAVYFRLRFQEIAKKLDSALVSPCTTRATLASLSSATAATPQWLLKETAEVSEAIRRCWDASVMLAPIADHFMRLTLQIVTRYRQWVQTGLDRVLASAAGTAASTAELSWSSLPPEQHLFVVRDVEKLAALLRTDLPSDIASTLPNYSRDILPLVREALEQSAASLDRVVSQLGQTIVVSALLRKCAEKLEPFRLLPANFRMTNKPMPTRPDHFIALSVVPLKAFLNEESTKLLVSPAMRSAWVQEVLSKLTDSFHELAKDLLANLLKGFKLRRQGTPADLEKTTQQVLIDVDAFGSSVLQDFVGPAESFSAYQKLRSTVTTMVADIKKELSLSSTASSSSSSAANSSASTSTSVNGTTTTTTTTTTAQQL